MCFHFSQNTFESNDLYRKVPRTMPDNPGHQRAPESKTGFWNEFTELRKNLCLK